MPRKKAASSKASPDAKIYEHTDAKALVRPEIGLQSQFKKKKPPASYQYDPSLDPQLQWSGKAERTSFQVPTLPLFIHERLSTEAILKTLKGHKRDKQMQFDLFGDPKLSIADRMLKAYEHKDKWTNRLILGDSLVVMNSLLQYEGMGGQVQMVYMDPPYGVEFNSNFQPFVRKRDVKNNQDGDLTREPEMVKAYRDTWELEIHSYLTYLRDRLLLSRDLLASTGSIFVQISDENLHHVRELMDEVFGSQNFVSLVSYVTTSGIPGKKLPRAGDYLLWYARDVEQMKYRQLYRNKQLGDDLASEYKWIRLHDGTTRSLSLDELAGNATLPEGGRVFRYGPLTSSGASAAGSKPFLYGGKSYSPGPNNHWKVRHSGLERLAEQDMLITRANSLAYYLFLDNFPVAPINNVWNDTKWGFDAAEKSYVVQTNTKVLERCILMTSDPGDLVLDVTCGSGTTAFGAEAWGRRWITVDVSRVPIALARQRLLTATYPYYKLKDESRGPAGGYVYERRKNKFGQEAGGVVPHVTLGNIANEEPSKEEVLVDRPEVAGDITRISGPFTVEATIPIPVDFDGDGKDDSIREAAEAYGDHTARMIEILRQVSTIRLSENRTVTFANVRPPAKTLSLSAEAAVQNGTDKPVAFVFGPENGAVSEKLVFNAAKEAAAKNYTHLYVIGVAIQPDARLLIDNATEALGVPATWVPMTMDVLMDDLLKNTRHSQVFAVAGQPDVRVSGEKRDGVFRYSVELSGVDAFDPITMEADHLDGADVPCWLLDTDYDGMVFHVSQAFFPRTSAWDSIKRGLKGVYEDSVWEHLAGTTSEPFEAGEHRQVAVKVIDDRGNELLVVQDLPRVK
jgi:adenine-specific DNA-methyltransferase